MKMRDLATKMAELSFVAPLAMAEDETDEWGTEQQITNISNNNNLNALKSTILLENNNNNIGNDNELVLLGEIGNNTSPVKKVIATAETKKTAMSNGILANNKETLDNFTETISGSLEDLVNTFDEKITKCFGNFEQSVEEIAPVQMRTQDEIMSECQMWWTITGNFGNILPIDWSKSYARQMHIPALRLTEKPSNGAEATDDELNDLSSEDEAVANDLDMHALILGGLHTETEPIKTAEEVLKEIDDIMDETHSESEYNGGECEAIEKAKEVLSNMHEEKLHQLTISQLNELYLEMETIIRELSETLISELALRDEFEYEKELKNSFISLLLAVQNRRRQYHIEKKRGKTQARQQTGLDPKYLTTVIPYHMDNGPPDNQTLQVLIKILKAINEDNPTVPTLLTDYILKVLCPT